MNTDHLQFLCDVGELGAALAGSSNIESFLEQLVRLVSHHLDAHVASIYLCQNGTQELVLRATVGLNPVCVGQTRLQPGEGLVGTTFAQREAILDNHASHNPLYRYFADIGEEQYESFIAVPIVRGEENIGVLTVQREEKNHFCDEDLHAMRVVSSQMAGCIANARTLMGIQAVPHQETASLEDDMVLVRAQVASSGYANGPAHIFRHVPRSLANSPTRMPHPLALADLTRALEQTVSQIEQLQAQVAAKLPEAVSLIFSAHLMMLMDRTFVDKITQRIENGEPVIEAVMEVAQETIGILAASSHAYMREKVQDIEDVTLRLLDNLQKTATSSGASRNGKVVIASGLYPSELVMLSLEEPAGIVLVAGGATSHVAILARSLQLPLLISDDTRLIDVAEGVPVLLDGDSGNIYLRPRDDVLREYTTRHEMYISVRDSARKAADVTTTQDGTRIELLANINLLRDVEVARSANAEGIGLYRTEFPFLIRSGFPDEDEQYLVYRRLALGMTNKPITIRTLDIGGDKQLGYQESPEEGNPELGLRSIRFSLKYPTLFAQQVSAILRAGAGTDDLRIMFPLISSIDELREVRKIVDACLVNLREREVEHHARPSIGMMVELPSVLETADEFCQEADFFSIGSNDFIQYMLAADRGNKNVASYYCPHHPAVLRGIARFVRTAQTHGRPVSVCGEMAHQTEYIPFLLGVGVRSLSVDPNCIVDLQHFIQSLDIAEVAREADSLLAECSIAGALQRLREFGRLTP